MGLVMIACFNSIMTTLLTARILNKDVMLYGTKVGPALALGFEITGARFSKVPKLFG